jgi:hypothetical protein
VLTTKKSSMMKIKMIARGRPMIDGSSVGFDFFVREPFVFVDGILLLPASF